MTASTTARYGIKVGTPNVPSKYTTRKAAIARIAHPCSRPWDERLSAMSQSVIEVLAIASPGLTRSPDLTDT